MDKAELGKKILEAAYLEGDFILSSGKRSKYYMDKYLFSTKPELLRAIAELAATLVPAGTTRLAGAELGAVPLAAALSLQTGMPYVIVKKQAKEYGTSKTIEGVLEAGDSVTLIEDIITTATQSIKAAHNLEAAGAKVLKIIGVIDREEGGAANIAEAGFDYVPMFTKTSLGI